MAKTSCALLNRAAKSKRVIYFKGSTPKQAAMSARSKWRGKCRSSASEVFADFQALVDAGLIVPSIRRVGSSPKYYRTLTSTERIALEAKSHVVKAATTKGKMTLSKGDQRKLGRRVESSVKKQVLHARTPLREIIRTEEVALSVGRYPFHPAMDPLPVI